MNLLLWPHLYWSLPPLAFLITRPSLCASFSVVVSIRYPPFNAAKRMMRSSGFFCRGRSSSFRSMRLISPRSPAWIPNRCSSPPGNRSRILLQAGQYISDEHAGIERTRLADLRSSAARRKKLHSHCSERCLWGTSGKITVPLQDSLFVHRVAPSLETSPTLAVRVSIRAQRAVANFTYDSFQFALVHPDAAACIAAVEDKSLKRVRLQ